MRIIRIGDGWAIKFVAGKRRRTWLSFSLRPLIMAALREKWRCCTPVRTNWHVWSGVNRPTIKLFNRRGGPSVHVFPTVVVDVNLMDWALPVSIHLGGPLLGRPGLTVRVGPVNIGWSRL